MTYSDAVSCYYLQPFLCDVQEKIDNFFSPSLKLFKILKQFNLHTLFVARIYNTSNLIKFKYFLRYARKKIYYIFRHNSKTSISLKTECEYNILSWVTIFHAIKFYFIFSSCCHVMSGKKTHKKRSWFFKTSFLVTFEH